MAKPQRWSRKKKILVSLVILAIALVTILVLLRENLAGMALALSRANYVLVAAALGLYLFSVLLWATRWRVSLSALGYQRRVRDLYLVIFSGIFITNITPFTYAGGDPLARGYVLNKTQKVPYSMGFATIMVELMLDLPIFFSLLIIGLLMSVYATSTSVMLIIIGGWLAAVVVLLSAFSYILSRRVGLNRIKGLVTRALRIFRRQTKKSAIASSINDFYRGGHAILGRWRIAARVSSFSIILWILSITRLFIIFQALNYPEPVPIPMLMLAVTLPAIVGLLPLLPGGLGTVDATIAGVFLVFIPPEYAAYALSATLIERSITLVFGTAVGASVASYLGVKVWRGAKTEER